MEHQKYKYCYAPSTLEQEPVFSRIFAVPPPCLFTEFFVFCKWNHTYKLLCDWAAERGGVGTEAPYISAAAGSETRRSRIEVMTYKDSYAPGAQ